MARGWESKSVESQLDSAAAARAARRDTRMTREQLDLESKRHSLMLSRTRVLHDLQLACNPRYRVQLEQALAYLDQQLKDLE
jgi:hypothetical protein